jgi:lipopolysaccharide transport system permease protein
MSHFSISPPEILRSLVRNRGLVWALIKREVAGRYQGSVFGLLWSFFNPLLMLVVYTIVFSVVFKARWVGAGDSKIGFALILFAGLMVYGIFSDSVNRAPSLVLNNANFVKKVVFPLEILTWVSVGSALVHFAISLVVWLLAYVWFLGLPKVSVLLLPFAILPLIFLTLGVSWILASLGVYLRDVAQIVGVFTTTLLFLSPIFYPASALPENYAWLLLLNPISPTINLVREILFLGGDISVLAWLSQLIGSLTFAWIGFAWFQKTRKGFADVL